MSWKLIIILTLIHIAVIAVGSYMVCVDNFKAGLGLCIYSSINVLQLWCNEEMVDKIFKL
jgi:hypothetical protein